MARHERDKVDTTLILSTTRVPQPSKRSLGRDYPTEAAPKNTKTDGKESNPTKGKQKQLTINTLLQKDAKRVPEGEACNPDGTLKEADEIDWVYSPSDETPSLTVPKRGRNYDDESSNEKNDMRSSKRARTDDTSIYFISHVLDPTHKLFYVEMAWEHEYVASAMTRLREIYMSYYTRYKASNQHTAESSAKSSQPAEKSTKMAQFEVD
ncbi:hypothetical protein JOM56_014455 [Amanita muscaria]